MEDISSSMGRLGYICSLVLLLLMMNPPACQSQEIKHMENGSTVLSPGSISGQIKSIKWLHSADIIADWFGREKEGHRHCKDRCDINTETGSLTINSCSMTDYGNYTVKIETKTGKLDIFHLNVTDCGKHTVKKNVPGIEVKLQYKWGNTNTIIIIIVFILIIIIAVALSIGIYCCYKHRENPEHLTGRIRSRGLSWLRSVKNSMASTPSSFQRVSTSAGDPTPQEETDESQNSSSSPSEDGDQVGPAGRTGSLSCSITVSN
ncbi:hypothetical protein OJAV_G00012800 [Oryzias javanicus]|uniref:Immunoglobulin subtype domain-containing protein n=1 Tax=Oryzias javanicus TaxID=123683 RepID=A0A437DIW8_ORYJA|nr:hypothetical protein OJAV_G00012800 [Oryzias javanicus]